MSDIFLYDTGRRTEPSNRHALYGQIHDISEQSRHVQQRACTGFSILPGDTLLLWADGNLQKIVNAQLYMINKICISLSPPKYELHSSLL